MDSDAAVTSADFSPSGQTKSARRRRESARSHESLPSVSETMELDITEEDKGEFLECSIYSLLLRL